MGKQNKSDTEIFEFVQPEVALSDLPAIETAKWGSKTSQIQKNLMLCNLNLHTYRILKPKPLKNSIVRNLKRICAT
jgi:hypothetical protein